MKFRSQFRDLKEWSESTNGCMQLNTPSEEAAKEYDATVTQFCGWYEDESIGCIEGTMGRMLKADPEFVLGRAFELEFELMGALNAPRLDSRLAKSIKELHGLVERKRGRVNELELLHVDVVDYWAKGDLHGASKVLERLTTLYPEDVAALKIAQDTYFLLGTALPMRNSLAHSLARMRERNPLKGYVHGMFSFALEESNMYEQSQRQAEKALSLIPFDTWAIHNYAHCLEMQAKTDQGLKWMYDRKADWSACQTLACHQYWHTALFHINNDQFGEAVALLDKEVLSRCVDRSTSLDLHDAASMIYRMELVDLFSRVEGAREAGGPGNQKRWSAVYDMCKPHSRDHLGGFNDVHFMMSFLGMDDLKLAGELIESVDEVPSLIAGQTVVKPLLEAMYQFKLGAYAKCVDLLEPIRFEIIHIGGSHAQRDIFEQLLLVAALKSDKQVHNRLAERMLLERETLHGRQATQTRLLAEAKA